MRTEDEAGRRVARGLRALLEGVVDYAGLFPPAALDMRAAVTNYRRYLEGPDAWMLGSLIVPVSRLDEFEREAGELLPAAGGGEPWSISALTAGAGDAGFEADLGRIDEFNATHRDAGAGLAAIEVVELRASTTGEIDGVLDRVPDALYPFFEIPVAADPRGLIAALAGSEAGAKVRTGGPTPASIPAPAELARFLGACAAAEVPFKATAGLHHPLRHHASAVGAEEYGFLNVFVAGIAAASGGVGERELVEILTAANLSSFRFGPRGLGWGDREVPVEGVEQARELATSFGSCSFEEPLEHLRALRLL